MFSIDQCRNILGKESDFSNEEIETLRDQMYGMANVAVRALMEQPPFNKSNSRPQHSIPPQNDFVKKGHFKHALEFLCEEGRYEAEERAAILEFDGQWNREDAEKRAVLENQQLTGHLDNHG